MPKKSKNFLDHANGLATELVDRIGPPMESAVGAAREKAGPVLVEARQKAAPVFAEAREKAAPVVSDARDRIATDLLPVITAAIVAADKATEEVRGETKKRGKATVAALKGEIEAPVKKKKRKRLPKLLLALGLAGAVAFVAKKLSDRPSTTTWESTPTTPPPAPASPVGAHRAEAADADDQGGASPDVAAADAASEPHEVSTPDDPAETIDVKRD